MLTLAFEHSTDQGSLALLDGDSVVAARSWCVTLPRSQDFFVQLEALWTAPDLRAADVELFAVGIGPGAFAALRMTVTAAQALALPVGKPVAGVCSAEALADQVLAESNVTAVTVLGDARRGALWAATYERREGRTVPARPLALIEDAGLQAASDADPALWVTPDWARIGPRLQALRPDAARLLPARRVPEALTVARLALAKRAQGLPPEPALPLYLHPPVAITPAPGGAPSKKEDPLP